MALKTKLQEDGVCALSDRTEKAFTPIPIPRPPGGGRLEEKYVSVVAGDNHVLVLTTHGRVLSFGINDCGQLCRRAEPRRLIEGTAPAAVIFGRKSKAVVIGAGADTSFAVDTNGDVWGWGLNAKGGTGTGFVATTDKFVHRPKKVFAVCKAALGENKYVI